MIFFQELSHNIIVILKDLIEAIMNCILLELNSMIQNNMEPIFTYIQFSDTIAFDDLPNEVVSLIEDSFKCVVFFFFFLVDLL